MRVEAQTTIKKDKKPLEATSPIVFIGNKRALELRDVLKEENLRGMSRYAPRWGTMVWGEPVIVKGCLSGRMIRGDMRSHCEVIGDGKDEDEPITGAMHRTIAKIPDDLLYTESCACEGNNCNAKKPKIRVPERSRCEAMVEVNVMGHNMTSKNNAKCTGEFCFKVEIRSKIWAMKNYRT
uniref:AWS domain-containing protein n=1 Tax=Meloidogyne hapla TaxID=6305 RepID=A0A1I8BLD8_MELHA